MRYVLLVCLLLSAMPTYAQGVALDTYVPAWSSQQQKTANVLSNVTLWSAVGLDTLDSWRSENRKRAFVMQGVRIGVAEGATAIAKLLVTRQRPCAPGCGMDRASSSFWSGHTALAFAASGGRYMEITLPLATGTGYFRIAANRHWFTDVLAGAGVGLATRFIR